MTGIKNLKNYGKPMNESMDEMSSKIKRKIRFASLKTMLRHLGIIRFMRIVFDASREQRRLEKHDYEIVRKKGIADNGFVNSQIQSAALFSAMAKVVGKEKALELQMEIAEKIACDVMSNMFPSVEELDATEDAFLASNRYLKAMFEANKRAGIHDYEIVEDSWDAFQANVTYCAFQAIPEEVGLGEACLASCRCDEIFLPEYCAQIGACFKRKSTLARGADMCDFRFERVKKGGVLI
jgi:hypothetical protein